MSNVTSDETGGEATNGEVTSDLSTSSALHGVELDMTHGTQDWRGIARLGKNAWWRYVLGLTLFFFSFLGLGGFGTGIFAAILLLRQGIPPEALTDSLVDFLVQPSIAAFVANNISFIFGLAGLALMLPLVHRRPLLSLLGAQRRVRWRRMVGAFGLWFAMLSLLGAVGYAIEPSEFMVTFEPRKWLSLLAVTLPLTLIQVSCEELFFRGYLLQGLGLLIRSKLVLALLGAVPFAMVHLANPEMLRGFGWMMFYYFAFGVAANWLTLKDNRLELALGFHLAINFFGILIVSSTDSVLPAPSMFTVDADGSPMWSVLVFLVEFAIFYFAFFGRRRRQIAIDPVEHN